jgi:hypothetical protein
MNTLIGFAHLPKKFTEFFQLTEVLFLIWAVHGQRESQRDLCTTLNYSLIFANIQGCSSSLKNSIGLIRPKCQRPLSG